MPGYDTRSLIEATEAGRVDTIMYLATESNPGHFHGLAARQTLVLIAAVFSRWVKGALPYSHHWL